MDERKLDRVKAYAESVGEFLGSYEPKTPEEGQAVEASLAYIIACLCADVIKDEQQ